MTVRRATLAAGLSALLSGPAASLADDPIPLYPDNYKVLYENDRVRVVDFRLRKGATEKSHSHPAHVAVFLADFKIRFTLPDGQTRMREARQGEIAYSEPTVHASENVGGTDAHGILVELKAPPAGGKK
jgi:quercetin dioxygenase-like cupin family protein